MRLHRLVRSFAAFTVLGLPAVAGAQGFGLNEIGSCAIGRGFAATGAPCKDASFIYWNPAAGTLQKGWSAMAGVAAVLVGGDFTADTSGRMDKGDVPARFPPHAFINYSPAGARWGAGFGVYVPYGLTSQWKEDFPGRFSALKAELASIYLQPNFSFEVVPGRLSIGGGPVFGHSSIELQQGVDLSTQIAAAGPPVVTFAQVGIAPGTEFARAKLKGSATAWGFNLGAHAQVTPTIQIGARYLSKLKFDYDDSDATFEQVNTGLVIPNAGPPFNVPPGTSLDAVIAGLGTFTTGPLIAQGVQTKIDHPAQFQVGVGYTGFPTTTLSLDYAWIGWKAFKELPVTFTGPAASSSRVLIEDYENSWSVRTGLEHLFTNKWAGRAGFSFVNTPVPDETVTPLLPDMDRFNFNVGVGIPFSERFVLDAGYLRVETEGRRGRIAERPDRTTTAAQINTGFYRLNANIFSVSLKTNF
jgi:long-chain fatty acid transport protein